MNQSTLPKLKISTKNQEMCIGRVNLVYLSFMTDPELSMDRKILQFFFKFGSNGILLPLSRVVLKMNLLQQTHKNVYKRCKLKEIKA